MKRLFWAIVHISTIYIAISGIVTYFNSTQYAHSSPNSTIVASAVTFEHSEHIPDPNRILAGVNEIRKKSGIPELTADKELEKEAYSRAQDMASQQYYSHIAPDGLNFFEKMQKNGIDPKYACENLLLTSTISESSHVGQWYISRDGHKECMLNDKISRAGYAVEVFTDPAHGADAVYYVVVAIHSTN